MSSSLQLEELYEYEKEWYDKIYLPFIMKNKERIIQGAGKVQNYFME